MTPKHPRVRLVFVPVGPSIAYVELTRGYFALIDSDDAERVGIRNWYSVVYDTGVYARCGGEAKGKFYQISLHRFIYGGKSEIVDHRNRRPLDCRKSNLREATPSQSVFNTKVRKDSLSGLKGVSLRNGKWISKIKFKKKVRRLGVFNTPEEAHAAYVNAAREICGKYANADR